jgi:polar amino acid transport system substrate-binding protein
MEKRSHIRTLICALAISAASWGANAEGTLTVGISTGYPPFDILNADGSVGGFDVDIAKAICEDQKKTCKFIQIEFDASIFVKLCTVRNFRMIMGLSVFVFD